jgi:hypothetical protein
MANWVSVTGNAVLPDAKNPVIVDHYAEHAILRPIGPKALKGVVHIPFSNSPNGNNFLKELNIKDNESCASVTRCRILQGGNQKYSVYGGELSPLENININGDGRKYGWTVTLDVQFDDMSAFIELTNLCLEFGP